MGNRGRASSAALSVATAVQTVQRPDAPYDLTDEETDEWRATVDSLPADWFPRETHALLTLYCRQVVNARRIAQLITQHLSADSLDVAAYDKLLAMQEREARSISSLMTRMRLTQQATVRAETAKKPKQVKKPWES